MTFLRFIPNAVEHSELKSLANFADTFFCYFLQNHDATVNLKDRDSCQHSSRCWSKLQI